MSRAGWVSTALVLLLALSLTGKFLVGYGPGPVDDHPLTDAVRQRLVAGGFETSVERRISGLVVHGARGSCRLIVRDGDSWPVLSTLFQQRAQRYGPLRYAYRGEATAEPPRARPLFDRLIRHIARGLGRDIARPALLAIAATPSCGAIAPLFNGITVTRPSSGEGNSLP